MFLVQTMVLILWFCYSNIYYNIERYKSVVTMNVVKIDILLWFSWKNHSHADFVIIKILLKINK